MCVYMYNSVHQNTWSRNATPRPVDHLGCRGLAMQPPNPGGFAVVKISALKPVI